MRYNLPLSLVLGAAIATGVLACTPNNRAFDASDFERGIGSLLPPGAHFLKAETRNWDLHGDHDACAVVEMPQAEFDKLRAEVLKNPSTGQRPALVSCSQEMYAEFSRYAVDLRQHSSVQGDVVRELALVRDRPIVLVQYSSW
jgi:hypothetical protein